MKTRLLAAPPWTGRIIQTPAALLFALFLAVIPHPPTAIGATASAGDTPGPSSTRIVLSLSEATEYALTHDEQLAQMRQAILGAEAQIMSAGSGRLPQVDLAGSWTRNLKKPSFFLPADMADAFGGSTAIEMGGDWDIQGAATMTMNLWTAGRLSAASGMAKEALRSTQWQTALVQDAVNYAVETAYFDVLLAAEFVVINESAMTLAQENLRVTQEAFDQGQSSRYDLLRAKVTATNRESPLVESVNDLHLANLKLLRVCGLDPKAELTLTDNLGVVDAPVELEVLLKNMNAQSAELKALEHQVLASKLSINLAKAGRGPVVQLQGQYALQGQWDDQLFPESDDAVSSASAALAFSMPIFDGFAAKADIQSKEADWRLAQIELERVTRDRELGVRQARTYLTNAMTALEGRREGVSLAEETYRLAVIRQNNGLSTPLERLDAELALTEAKAQLASALYACNTATSGLKLAVGGIHNPVEMNEEN